MHKNKKMIKFLIKYIKKQKKYFYITFLATLLIPCFTIFDPIFWGKAVGNIMRGNFNGFVKYVLLFAVIWFVRDILLIISSRMESRFYAGVIKDFRLDMYKKIVNLPIEVFDKMNTGELINRVADGTSDIVNVSIRIIDLMVRVIRDILIIIVMFFICKEIALVYIGICFVIYIVHKTYGKKIKRIAESIKKNSDSYVSNLHQSILGVREIKALGIKQKAIKNFSNIINVVKDKNIKSKDIKSGFDMIASILRLMLWLIVFIIAGYKIFIRKLLVDYIVPIGEYTHWIINTITDLTNLGIDIQKALVSLERIYDMLNDQKYQSQEYGNKNIILNKADIYLKDIKFEYEKGIEVLEGVNLHIKNNTKVAFVGRSGVGKSTIFNLLLRFYDVKEGEILVNNFNIKDLTEECLRDNITVIRQEPFLFNMSVKENIKIAKTNASFEEIVDASKKAYIHEYIESLPNGYDTIIGEGGINLSGGQKQRIAIARAIIRKSKILLFDEATSALDNKSQEYIKRVIDELSNSCTIIIIAHRLNTIIDCDEICFMDKGKVLDKGSHLELMNKCESYKLLYLNEV